MFWYFKRKKRFYFPRHGFKIYRNKDFGAIRIISSEDGVSKVDFDHYAFFDKHPQVGDVWVTTAKGKDYTVALVFIKIDEPYYYGEGDGNTCFTATLQNFGYEADLQQIETMKSYVIQGGTMKPVVLGK